MKKWKTTPQGGAEFHLDQTHFEYGLNPISIHRRLGLPGKLFLTFAALDLHEVRLKATNLTKAKVEALRLVRKQLTKINDALRDVS